MRSAAQPMSGRWTQYGVQGLEAVGIDVEALSREVGLSYEALIDPAAWIDHRRFAKLWSKAVRATGNPNLGLHAAEHFRPAATDLLLHLLISCRTLGDGIERATGFFELAGDVVGPKFIRRPTETVFLLADRKVDQSAWVEFRVAAYFRFAEMATQRELHPYEVRFRHADRGAPRELYDRVYRCPVRFSAIENGLVVSEDVLALHLPNACEETAHALQRAAATAVVAPQRASIERQVRLLVRAEIPAGDFSETAIALSMRMSERTLKRRLAEAEWTFSHLVDDVRRRLALDLLVSTPASLDEVAKEVGYSSAGSLVRAVKRWTGYTPSALRHAKVDARSA